MGSVSTVPGRIALWHTTPAGRATLSVDLNVTNSGTGWEMVRAGLVKRVAVCQGLVLWSPR